LKKNNFTFARHLKINSMKKEILVSEKSIEKADGYINSLNEKKYQGLSGEFLDEQPAIRMLLGTLMTEGGFDMGIVGEIMHLSTIIWQSFKNECGEVPVVNEGVIERIAEADLDRDIDFGKSLGLDLNDAEISEKIDRLSKKFSKEESPSHEDVLKLIEGEGLHNFIPALLENVANLPQANLENYITAEIIEMDDNDEYGPTELANAQSVLRIIIKSFDTVINHKPLMQVVKPQKVTTGLEKSIPAKESSYQIKISLDGIKPPIWRRVLVEGDISLDDFHNIILDAMGWEGYHLYNFRINNSLYSVVDEDDFGLMDYIDSEEVKLSDVVYKEKQKFKYTYDFGDNWKHTILIEKILPFDDDQDYPVCIKGKRNCPPEDCGGIWGYQNLLEAIGDKNHPEHEELLEWAGGDFDPEEFSLDGINACLY